MQKAFCEMAAFGGQSLAGLFFKAVDRNADKKAIWCDGAEMSYHEFGTLVCRLANYLGEHGVHHGDIIGIPMSNCIESVALMIAAAAVGAALEPINPTLPAEAIDKAFQAGNVKHLVGSRTFFHSIQCSFLDSINGCRLCLDGQTEGADGFDAVMKASDSRPDLSAITGKEPLILAMTSGATSTGVFHPVVLTQENKLQRIQAHIRQYQISPDDCILAATPLYHSLAERLVLMPLMIGATSVLLSQFTPLLWMNSIRDQNVTFTIAVSAQLTQVVQLLSSPFAPEVSSLRAVVSSSAPLEQYVRNELIRKLHCDLYEMYGTSECSTVTSINFRECAEKRRSVGRPLPGVQIRILGDNGQSLAAGEIGEIAVKTYLKCAGYYGMPGKSEALTDDGYFRTGDLGKLDEDGYLYYSGRKRDLIITGGVNVYPQDVESKIQQIPAVKECAAFSFEDERLGEVVAVAIVLNAGAELTKKQVQEFCAQTLADYQQPCKVFFIDELPQNAMGKLMKTKLPEAVAGKIG